MSENSIQTRSKVGRSPPAVRKLVVQSTLPPKPPVRARGSHSSPENNNSGDINEFFDQTSTVAGYSDPRSLNVLADYSILPSGRDDGAIMNALEKIQEMVRGLDMKFTNKIDDLRQSVSNVQQEVIAVKQDLKDVLASQIADHSEQLATHDARLDDVEASIRELRNSTEAATKAADLIIKGIPLLSTDNPVNLYLGVATALGFDSNTTPMKFFGLERRKSAAHLTRRYWSSSTEFSTKMNFSAVIFATKT